jgi:hypothetical protein
VTTTPVTEFGLVIKGMGITTGPASKVWQDFAKNGGKGSNGWKTRADLVKKTVTAHGCTLEKVLVPDTQCCRQKGGEVPEDLRVLHPIEAFGDFGENGRLRSRQIYDADTLLQKEVKKAGLTRAECVAVVLYTGTLSDHLSILVSCAKPDLYLSIMRLVHQCPEPNLLSRKVSLSSFAACIV